jgi:hypothetical protein
MGSSSLFTWLFLGVLIYLGVGVANNVSQGTPPGPDALPHKEFWAQVATLTLAGCIFARDKVCEMLGSLSHFDCLCLCPCRFLSFPFSLSPSCFRFLLESMRKLQLCSSTSKAVLYVCVFVCVYVSVQYPYCFNYIAASFMKDAAMLLKQ